MSKYVRPVFHKYSIDELMEVIDVFKVSSDGQKKIRAILENEAFVPDAGKLFRYYNPESKVPLFESELAAITGASHCLAVNSGTSALIAALVAAGVGPGDEVIVPAYTFFASVSAIVVAKAIPVITEINESLTLDPAAVEKNITSRTKAIMPVHMIGHQADMDKICAIAKKHNLRVIEDAAQAFGGSYKGRYLGTMGALGCFSFDANKLIGVGEGGAILTDDDWLFTRAQSYHDTAACWRPDRYARERQQGELFCGENYRISELSAAVGLAQLRKVKQIIERCRAGYRLLREEIKLPSFVKWVEPNDPDGVSGYALAMLFDDPDIAMRAMKARFGIGGLAINATNGARDWHVYWNWEHILDRKTATAEGCPFKCPHVTNLPDYSPDMCPVTTDIMLRLGIIGISPADTPDSISRLADDINRGLSSLKSCEL